MILRILFYAFLVYLLYKVVFGLIIPVYRTTRRVKKSFREMQDRMQQQANPYGRPAEPVTLRPERKNDGEGKDYIEFEEVK